MPEEVKPEAARKPAADMTGQGTILLVEDEDPVRAVNARALSARGYTVLEAASGVEALEIIQERGAPVDLVVSDVVMPEMDGPTLLGELRKLYPGPEGDLRLRLCRGSLPQEPAGRGGVQLPAQALQPAPAGRDGEAGHRPLNR